MCFLNVSSTMIDYQWTLNPLAVDKSCYLWPTRVRGENWIYTSWILPNVRLNRSVNVWTNTTRAMVRAMYEYSSIRQMCESRKEISEISKDFRETIYYYFIYDLFCSETKEQSANSHRKSFMLNECTLQWYSRLIYTFSTLWINYASVTARNNSRLIAIVRAIREWSLTKLNNTLIITCSFPNYVCWYDEILQSLLFSSLQPVD
jgi:hypothetical protein